MPGWAEAASARTTSEALRMKSLAGIFRAGAIGRVMPWRGPMVVAGADTDWKRRHSIIGALASRPKPDRPVPGTRGSARRWFRVILQSGLYGGGRGGSREGRPTNSSRISRIAAPVWKRPRTMCRSHLTSCRHPRQSAEESLESWTYPEIAASPAIRYHPPSVRHRRILVRGALPGELPPSGRRWCDGERQPRDRAPWYGGGYDRRPCAGKEDRNAASESGHAV